MRTVMEFWRTVRSLRRRNELEAGLCDEIRFHIDQQTDKNLRAGLPPNEARRQALIKFGAMENAKESIRDEIRAPIVEALMRDLRYALRALRRSPGFTIAATLTLALGIGATTAMFSVLNGVVLRPLPYPEQDRLVELVHSLRGVTRLAASPAVYFGYRDHGRVFEAVGLWDWDSSPVTVVGAGEPETVQSVEVTHEVLPILGARPVAGRSFTPADDRPGSAPTAIISHGYWQRRLGGGDAIGRTLTVDGVPRQVIGVLPQWFNFFDYPAEIFYPLQPERSEAVFPSGDGRGIARLKEGVTIAQANADVARIVPILDAEYPGGNAQEVQFAPNLTRLKDRVVDDLSGSLWLLMGTIALLLTMACANVANLVLVRTHARSPELAVRSALGAGWAAVARVVWTESALLATAGGIAGVALAYVSLPFLVALGAADLPRIRTVEIDLTALLVAFGASAIAAGVCGVLPLVHMTWPRLRLATVQQREGRATTGGRESHRTRQVLVVSQVAVALILLIAAGLMARAFQTLRAIDPGFRDPDSVQTFQLTIPSASDATSSDADAALQRILRMQHEVVDRLTAIPGVEAAGFSSSNDGLPLDDDGRSGPIFFEGKTVRPEEASPLELLMVSAGFLETLQVPLLAGRLFDRNDVERRGVALVTENLARSEWGAAASALGKRLTIFNPDEGPWFEVVGVVKDMPQQNLDTTLPKTVIFPALARNATASFVIRSARAGTASLLSDIGKALQSVHGGLAPATVQTLGEMYRRSMARTSMMLLVLGITGTVALLLGLVGVYGIVSYAVTQRRREIGIRLALGAAQRDVRVRFVRQALILVSIGVAIGLAAATGLTQFMTSQLFGVSPLDAPTLVTVALVLLTAAGLASYVSAQRASTLDPVEVLKG
jgi:predicted permease